MIGALYEVVARRHDAGGKATLVTTNLSLEQIATVYDASVASRMAEWELVVMVGKDHRMVIR